MIQIKSYYSNVGMGVKVPIGITGGVEPYTVTIEPGGAGGSISPDYVYTSPYKVGKDIIKVVDANLEEKKFTIYTGTALQLVCFIIRSYMGLAEDQVYLFNQKIMPPKDSRLYIAVSQLTSKSFGSSSNMESTSGLEEVMSVNMHSLLDITIYSKTTEALDRKEEVIAALGSTFSRQQQEMNSFYIAKLSPNVVPLNYVDGAAIPYMFNVSTAIQYVSKYRRSVDFYDQFFIDEVITNP